MSADLTLDPPQGWEPERSAASRALFPHLTPEALRLFWLRSRGYAGPVDRAGNPVGLDLDDEHDAPPPAPTPVGAPTRVEVEPIHPGAATFRGHVVLPDGTPVRVRAGRDTVTSTTLRPTGRTRRVKGLPGRTPVLTGYTGGPIPVETHGTVRVGINWRAIVFVVLPWIACAVAGAWGQLVGRVEVSWAAVAAVFVVGVLAPFVAAPKGLRVPVSSTTPRRRSRATGRVRSVLPGLVKVLGVAGFLGLSALVFVRVLDVASAVTR